MAPTEQKALLLTEPKGSFSVGTIPVPKPGPGEILVKIQATALNPVDWKIQVYGLPIKQYPAVLGEDLAGTVEELGEGVTGFAKGDKVLSESQYGRPGHTTFQQYALTNDFATAKIPDNISFEEAASVPLGLGTAAVGLYGTNGGAGLTPPWEAGGRGKYQGKPIVVYGGSSSVGQFAIQLAKLSGFNPIIATASLHNTDALKQLGATHMVDRNLPADAVIAEIAKIASAPIEIVYDAISLPDTQNTSYDLLAPGGVVAVVAKTAVDEKKLTKDKRIEHVFGDLNADRHRALGVGVFSHLTAWLEDGLIKPNRVEVLPNGLEGIIAGLEKLRKGVSNVKLVAHPQETA